MSASGPAGEVAGSVDSVVERVSPFYGTEHFDDELQTLTAILGTPTFVQPGSWAQFDAPGARVSLGAGEENLAETALMVKVSDLDRFCSALVDRGCVLGELHLGAHEQRVVVTTPQGRTLIAYRPL